MTVPEEFCQVLRGGIPCGIRSDDVDGVCVFCKDEAAQEKKS